MSKGSHLPSLRLYYACITPVDRVHHDLDRAPYHDGALTYFVAG